MKGKDVFESFFNILDEIISGQDLGCAALYIILQLKEHIKNCLNELLPICGNDFADGEKSAYIECLEFILIFCGVNPDKLIELEKHYGII